MPGINTKDPEIETAILYRTNAQSRALESLFMTEGQPYTIVGALRFFERMEVKDVLAYIKLLLNPHDELAFRRVINKPVRGLGPKTVDSIIERVGSGTLIDGVKNDIGLSKGRRRQGLQDFLNIFKRIQDAAEVMELKDLVSFIFNESGLKSSYKDNEEEREQNIGELMNATEIFPPGISGLVDFVETLGLDPNIGRNPDAIGKVTLITIHNTKGLEFDRVIITGMEEGLFPRGDDTEEIEEERRLLYVAITRARKELHFTWCTSRRLYGRIQMVNPSPFIYELPVDMVEQKSSEDDGEWSVGSGVYHDDYGTGMVVKRWHNGSQLVILVRFQSGQTAQFIPKYTPLEKVSLDTW